MSWEQTFTAIFSEEKLFELGLDNSNQTVTYILKVVSNMLCNPFSSPKDFTPFNIGQGKSVNKYHLNKINSNYSREANIHKKTLKVI